MVFLVLVSTLKKVDLPTLGNPEHKKHLRCADDVVVYHVTNVAFRHLLKKCWPMAFYVLQGIPLFETIQTYLLR